MDDTLAAEFANLKTLLPTEQQLSIGLVAFICGTIFVAVAIYKHEQYIRDRDAFVNTPTPPPLYGPVSFPISSPSRTTYKRNDNDGFGYDSRGNKSSGTDLALEDTVMKHRENKFQEALSHVAPEEPGEHEEWDRVFGKRDEWINWVDEADKEPDEEEYEEEVDPEMQIAYLEEHESRLEKF